jgi:hypothetical protein
VAHSIREYCERAKQRFDQCTTFELTRQFLVDHVQRIVYLRGKVTLLGSVPVKRGTFQAAVAVPFRIEDELDRRAIRAKPRKLLPDDGRWKKLKEAVAQALPASVKIQLMTVEATGMLEDRGNPFPGGEVLGVACGRRLAPSRAGSPRRDGNHRKHAKAL